MTTAPACSCHGVMPAGFTALWEQLYFCMPLLALVNEEEEEEEFYMLWPVNKTDHMLQGINAMHEFISL